MSDCRRFSLIAAVLLWTAGVLPAVGASAEYLGTYVWRDSRPDFGGFSAIEISPDGSRFHALSDRAVLFWGAVRRGASGLPVGMEILGQARLQDSKGAPLPPGGWTGDLEGIAVDAEGRIYVSFEGLHRVARYDTPDSPAKTLPRPEAFERFQRNSGLEALAIDAQGALWAVPERSGRLDRPFPLWRFRDGDWDQSFTIPRSGNWLPVGADFGPDGAFYLLERDFWGVLGFLTRVRRFRIGADSVTGGEVLIETGPSRHDNLEGISVWADAEGIRITMISDDNFFWAQRSEIVEYRVRD